MHMEKPKAKDQYPKALSTNLQIKEWKLVFSTKKIVLLISSFK